MVQFGEMGRQPWYVGNVSRASAESMVRSCARDGSFVVRQSQKGGKSNPFTLTLFHATNVYNLHIRQRADDKFAIGSEKPDEIVSLLCNIILALHVRAYGQRWWRGVVVTALVVSTRSTQPFVFSRSIN